MTAKRIILVGDPHLRDRPPSSCTDIYPQDLLDMLSYVAKIEKKIKADAVVLAGDIFDHKQPSKTPHKLILRTIEVLKEFNNVWAIAGNHDLTQDRIDSLFDQQPLGVLIESGALRFLDGWHSTLPLYGVSWQQRWNHEGVVEEVFEDWRKAPDVIAGPVRYSRKLEDSLVVTHCPLYPPGKENPFEVVDTKEVANAMGNVGSLYYGHIHDYHGIFNVDGVEFCNVGSLSRGSLNEENRHRGIKVAVWIEGQGFKEVPIPHRPAEEIFRLAEVDKARADKLDLDNFLEEVGNSTIDITSIESLISQIKERQDIEPRVRKLAVEMIEAAN